MLDISLSKNSLSKIPSINCLKINVQDLIIRDLSCLGWHINNKEKIIVSPPDSYTKKTIQESMLLKRQQLIEKKSKWIEKHIDLARENLANGTEVIRSEITPTIEVCTSPEQHNLFRILRYYWSSPYSEYVGRRIRLLIRDDYLPNKPVIGIAALGSPIIHIPERDNWIEWDKNTRTDNLIYTMDAYVLGALPPYNYLLGGKLVSYIMASNEIRKIYNHKYKDKVTIIKKRKANDLVCIFVTSLYGRSSIYNRIKFNDKLLYNHIGETKGYGSLHLSNETFSAMIELLKQNNIYLSNRFGGGPSWKMRVIRVVGGILGFDTNSLLKHSFKRWIYAIPLAKNFREFLIKKDNKPLYYDYPLDELVTFWKKRWLSMRKKSPSVIANVRNFDKNKFQIS